MSLVPASASLPAELGRSLQRSLQPGDLLKRRRVGGLQVVGSMGLQPTQHRAQVGHRCIQREDGLVQGRIVRPAQRTTGASRAECLHVTLQVSKLLPRGGELRAGECLQLRCDHRRQSRPVGRVKLPESVGGCGEQLDRSMAMVARAGTGVILYLRQEGRGIGLLEKLRAYNLQDQGFDTVDANLMLGHEADGRDYSLAALILEELGVSSVRLITNNPAKISALQDCGIDVSERVSLEVAANADNADYLLTKVQRMDHLLQLKPASSQ